MKFFNRKKLHVHYFKENHKEAYMSAFKQIVIEHKTEATIIRKCKCGATETRKAQIGFQMT